MSLSICYKLAKVCNAMNGITKYSEYSKSGFLKNWKHEMGSKITKRQGSVKSLYESKGMCLEPKRIIK